MNKLTQKNDELIAISNYLFVETSPFSEGLGLRVESMSSVKASMGFSWRDNLTGSIRTPNLHGGVIAAVMDVTGSLVVFSNMLHRMKKGSWQEKIKRVKRINTIDLRIDFLRPGAGNSFIATGNILRTGMTVAVSRVELRNEEDRLIAAGTGSYFVKAK